MKIYKKLFLILFLLILIIELTSCWNYREIENYEIVAGIALDKQESTGRYILTSEIIEYSKGEKESKISSKIVQSVGDSIFDTVRNTIKETGRKLYFSHTKIMIINKKIAEEGIFPILDWVNRDHETRHNIELFICEENAGDMFYKAKERTDEIISYTLVDKMSSDKSVSKTPDGAMWKFINMVEAEDINGVLPMIRFENHRGNHIPEASGTGIFKKDKLIGTLNEEDTKILLFIDNKIKGGLFIIEDIYEEPYRNVVLEIYKNKTKIEPKHIGDSIIMQINIKTDVGINENMGTENFTDLENKEKLEKLADSALENKINNLVKKVQKEFKVDIFGFGKELNNQMPDLWDKVKDDWEEIFTSVKIEAKSNFIIKDSGFSSYPLRPGK